MENSFLLTPYFLDEPMPGLETLLQPGWTINQEILSDGPKQIRMAKLYEPLADFTSQTLHKGLRPVSIAGDCCTSIGVLAGLQRSGFDPTLIWFDAHGDFNTWETTPSGFLGGMPLAMLVGRGEQTITASVGLKPIDENKVFLTDGRDLDPGERSALVYSNVTHFKRVADLLTMPAPKGDVYIHLDTDVIDPAIAPAMNYPSPGGPTIDILRSVFNYLARNCRIIAISLSSWNPEMDSDGSTQEVCMDLFSELMQ